MVPDPYTTHLPNAQQPTVAAHGAVNVVSVCVRLWMCANVYVCVPAFGVFFLNFCVICNLVLFTLYSIKIDKYFFFNIVYGSVNSLEFD